VSLQDEILTYADWFSLLGDEQVRIQLLILCHYCLKQSLFTIIPIFHEVAFRFIS